MSVCCSPWNRGWHVSHTHPRLFSCYIICLSLVSYIWRFKNNCSLWCLTTFVAEREKRETPVNIEIYSISQANLFVYEGRKSEGKCPLFLNLEWGIFKQFSIYLRVLTQLILVGTECLRMRLVFCINPAFKKLTGRVKDQEMLSL